MLMLKSKRANRQSIRPTLLIQATLEIKHRKHLRKAVILMTCWISEMINLKHNNSHRLIFLQRWDTNRCLNSKLNLLRTLLFSPTVTQCLKAIISWTLTSVAPPWWTCNNNSLKSSKFQKCSLTLQVTWTRASTNSYGCSFLKQVDSRCRCAWCQPSQHSSRLSNRWPCTLFLPWQMVNYQMSTNSSSTYNLRI